MEHARSNGAKINAIRRARSRGSPKWPRYPWRITDVARQQSNFSISSSTHRLEATRHPLLSIFIIRGEVVPFVRVFRFPPRLLPPTISRSLPRKLLSSLRSEHVRVTKYWRRCSKIFNDLSRPGGKKEKRRKKKKREEIANNGRKMRENSIRSCCCYYCKCIWLFANTHKDTLSGKRAKRGVLRPLSADPLEPVADRRVKTRPNVPRPRIIE